LVLTMAREFNPVGLMQARRRRDVPRFAQDG
jgi:hypothetical protein